MPVSEAARIMNENDTKLWRMIRRYAEAARSGKDESGVKHMGTDEASVRGSQLHSRFRRCSEKGGDLHSERQGQRRRERLRKRFQRP